MALPIGNSNFREIRGEGDDYVDKTAMLDRILRDKGKILLFTRPRRFGKSLNLSMMDAYFNIRDRGNDWFDGLAVSELRPDDPMKNAFPVIRINLKDTYADTFDGFLSLFRVNVLGDISWFGDLLDSDRLNEMDRQTIWDTFSKTADEATLAGSLRTLSRIAEKHYGAKAVILVDEYDSVLNRVTDDGLRRRFVSFLRNLFSAAFKDNDSLQLGVVTGVLQITKEGLFSGLNNLVVDNVLTDGFSDSYGFTEDEVGRLLEANGASDRFPEVREWYDGYRFGCARLYNPWSVLMYLYRGCRPEGFWTHTAGNDILDQLLDREDVFGDLSALTSGGSVRHPVRPDMTYDELFASKESFLSIMVSSGYLSAVPAGDGTYELSIPNREIRDALLEMASRRRTRGFDAGCGKLVSALREGDAHGVEDSLTSVFTEFESFRILGRESDYHNFLYGLLLGTARDYVPSVEGEAGEGYYDICLRSLDPAYPNAVMELKRMDRDSSDEAAEAKAREALDQAISRNYAFGLGDRTVLYGVVFRSKTATVLSLEI